jgi:hypothetical protein
VLEPLGDGVKDNMLIRRTELFAFDDLPEAVRVELEQSTILVQLLKFLECTETRLTAQRLAADLLCQRPVV